jgi:hypothetical protein
MLAETQRVSILRAMGIEVFRLRAAAAPDAVVEAGFGSAQVVVVCTSQAVPGRFRAQLPYALGIAPERVRWCEREAEAPEDAAAYVVIGTEAARALGVQLSTMQQNRSIIAATADVPDLLRDGSARRALWQSLKPVARRMREVA